MVEQGAPVPDVLPGKKKRDFKPAPVKVDANDTSKEDGSDSTPTPVTTDSNDVQAEDDTESKPPPVNKDANDVAKEGDGSSNGIASSGDDAPAGDEVLEPDAALDTANADEVKASAAETKAAQDDAVDDAAPQLPKPSDSNSASDSAEDANRDAEEENAEIITPTISLQQVQEASGRTSLAGINGDDAGGGSKEEAGRVGLTMMIGSRHHVRLHEIEKKLADEVSSRVHVCDDDRCACDSLRSALPPINRSLAANSWP